MASWRLSTPVAFLIFNRPETTRRVFGVIRQARPPKLLVVADGPRSDHPAEDDKCQATRSIIDQVDWECEVLTNYSAVNLGCKRRISSGLNWVFETAEQAIILEDDCLPHPTFFPYCEELLNRYAEDKRVMAISGDNFQFGRKRMKESYYFSRYPHVWGWATWRRAWRNYDVEMRLWPIVKEGNWLKDVLGDPRAVNYWTRVFQSVHDGDIDTWDFQWVFACWIQSGFCILPNTNLVANTGFSTSATHTQLKSRFANMRVDNIGFPLRHPPFLIRDAVADAFTQESMFRTGRFQHVKGKIKSILYPKNHAM